MAHLLEAFRHSPRTLGRCPQFCELSSTLPPRPTSTHLTAKIGIWVAPPRVQHPEPEELECGEVTPVRSVHYPVMVVRNLVRMVNESRQGSGVR